MSRVDKISSKNTKQARYLDSSLTIHWATATTKTTNPTPTFIGIALLETAEVDARGSQCFGLEDGDDGTGSATVDVVFGVGSRIGRVFCIKAASAAAASCAGSRGHVADVVAMVTTAAAAGIGGVAHEREL